MAKAATLFFFLGALPFSRTIGDQREVDQDGRVLGGKPVRNTLVETECECPMFGAHLACDGLDRSAIPLDVSKIKQHGKEFYLKHGIAKLHSNTFE
ncbi:hypothetical protein ACP4OV_008929 [Aristida adscensionis]